MNPTTRHLHYLPFLSHVVVAIVGASVTYFAAVSYWAVLGLGLLCVAIMSYWLSHAFARHLELGLELIEQAVVTNEKPAGETIFDDTAEKLVNHVTRLAAAAAKGRQQSREVKNVLSNFDRRGSRDDAASPARQLSQLLRSLGREAQGAIDDISMTESELQALRAQMMSASNDEFELVKTAASEIRKLAKDIASITDFTKRAKASDVSAAGKSEAVSRQLLELKDRLDHLREQVGFYDKRSQSFRDQMSEVNSLVQTINEYSAKTDTMALNASIESVKAGEHGLAFAAAADEIRRMTSIISTSTSDAMDRLKLIEDGIDDAADSLEKRHASVDRPATIVRELSESVSKIRQSTDDSRQHLDRVLESTEAELRNLNNVANALGGVFESAERAAVHCEEEQKIRAHLNDRLFELSNLLAPLTSVAQAESTTQMEAPPVASNSSNESDATKPLSSN